jgi:hypothetical protein
VRASGHHATNDELHNVMEAMVGAEYGMQTGIWWYTGPSVPAASFESQRRTTARICRTPPQLDRRQASIERRMEKSRPLSVSRKTGPADGLPLCFFGS